MILTAAGAWAAGLGLGAMWPGAGWWWLGAGVVALMAMGVQRKIAKPQAALWLIALGLTAASWWTPGSCGLGSWGHMSLARYLGDKSVLMDVTGLVVDGPVVDTEAAEGLGRFVFFKPRTRWVIAVEKVHVSGNHHGLPEDGHPGLGGQSEINSGGRLLMSLSEVDTRWEIGDRVRCQGWAAGLGEAMNPGEHNSAATFAREGIVGRLWLRDRGNARLVEAAGRWSWRAMRARWVERAQTALNAGFAAAPGLAKPQAAGEGEAMAFIDALVLGQRRGELEDVYPAFRLTGLAHALSISGLHVGLVAMVAWAGALILTGRPRWAAVASLLAVPGYVWMVPWDVPIVRAGFMTGICCVGLTWGRRWLSAAILGWIGLIWLVIRPGDLFDAGFQLSYGIVAALLLWTEPMARWMLPARMWSAEEETGWWAVRRWLAQYVSVGLVAWLAAMPIVAYQFGMVNPLAAVVGVVMLPMLAGMLWLGLGKVVVGLIWPAAGAAMGGAVLMAGRWCVDAVTWISHQPGVALDVPRPGGVWTLAALAVTAAVLSGRFARRYAALGACGIVLGIGLYAGTAKPQAAILECTALAVGDGSCFVIRSHNRTWLFDCGSGQRRNVGERVIAPALKAMGVEGIDTLVISHGDFDHFSGTLEVCDAMPVRRIVTSDAVLREADEQPHGATAALVRGLRERRLPIQTAAIGWRDQLGDANVETLWPPAADQHITFKTSNDGSLVMRFTVNTPAGPRRLMMNGDIQGVAMSLLAERGIDVSADVTDLPHHGSFPPGVLDWLRRVHPRIVLQSTGPRKLNWDKWAGHTDGMMRLITARLGAVTVRLNDAGNWSTSHFAGTGETENPLENPPDNSNDSSANALP
ncbi:MAG: ComEC/Rec2 family competence protein [Phycisphaerales bacterium]